MTSRRFGRLATLAVAAGVVAALAASGGTASNRAAAGRFQPLGLQPIQGTALTAPEPTSKCLATLGVHCYSPAQLEKAYNLAALHAAGIDGRGQTIAIVDSFGSPTIRQDLHAFDQEFGAANNDGIPIDPAIAQDPNLTIIQPAGPVPPFSLTDNNGDEPGWGIETTRDVEWAHVFAPKANILLVETPTDETEGIQGFPEMIAAENYVIDHHLANIISQSFGATEETFPGTAIPDALRTAYIKAQQAGVTVLGASGDEGSTDFELNVLDLYPFQVNSWPSSDPLVTSVGGSKLTLDDAGNRISPDVVWNDTDVGIQAAGGGGLSKIFSRPSFQDGVQSVVGSARGTPDISMNAAVDGGVWTYYTFLTQLGIGTPWHIVGGTSAATPEFAGIVALADQVAGQRLGDINQALYTLGSNGPGVFDITSGNNDIGTFTNSGGEDNGTFHVPGFDAGPGYDLASGLGTVGDAAQFVPALACAALASSTLNGNFTVPTGAPCTLTDTTITGNVMLGQGATLTLNGGSVAGNVQGQGASGLTLTPDSSGNGTHVGGNVQIQGATGNPNVICGATIGGNLQVLNGSAPAWIGKVGSCGSGNTVNGNALVLNNRVSGQPAAAIVGNTMHGILLCQNNSLAPTGSGNTAAVKLGQCSGF